MATLLVGYDVERMGEPRVTRAFLKSAAEVHGSTGTKATLFCVGKTVEESPGQFMDAAESGLFDMEQHTYSHVLLKSVYEDSGDRISFYPGGSLDQLEDEVMRAKEAISRITGVVPVGICGPYCYYRGLADRPDILAVLERNGIRFTRTWGRNEKDWQPVPTAVQPFRYGLQGYPSILEIPLQGWQDCIWREMHGWSETSLYLDHLKGCIDSIAGTDLAWSYCQHDWSSIREDPDMSVMRGLLEYALDSGITVATHIDFCDGFTRGADSISA